MRAFRSDDRLSVRDDRVAELGEEERPRRDAPTTAFGHVLAIVEADTHDLARAREGRDELELVHRQARRSLERSGAPGELLERVGIEIEVRQHPVQERDHTIADEEAGPRVLGPEEGDQAHAVLLGRQLAEADGTVDAAALGVALGTALSLAAGLALGPGVPLGAALTPGEALGEFGVGQSGSEFVRPPHCCQNCCTRSGSHASIISTRPHTIAWNGVLI